MLPSFRHFLILAPINYFTPSTILVIVTNFLAFDAWKKEQMDEKYIGAVYSMLAEKGKVLPKFPIEYVRQGIPAKSLKVCHNINTTKKG